MIITTLEELRLHLPANAIDNVESLTGFIETAEYDTLRDKLGKPLYNLLIDYYSDLGETGISDFISDIQSNTALSPYARLLFLSQRIVAFDAVANAVGAHVVSINGAGINTMTADDYPQADKEKIATFQSTCRTECHKSINLLLETLEDWVKDLSTPTTNAQPDGDDTTSESSSAGVSTPSLETVSEESTSDPTIDSDSVASSVSTTQSLDAITTAWQSSRFYFLSAGMIIPTALVLQDYLNIYENREKFILMLPDIRYIHEEVIAQSIGDDFLAYLTSLGVKGVNTTTVPNATASDIALLSRIITRLRKAAVAHLEARTLVLRTDKDRRTRAHDEAISLTDQICEYIHNNQDTLIDIFTAIDTENDSLALLAFKNSPLYLPPLPCKCSHDNHRFKNNRRGNAFFATPGLR